MYMISSQVYLDTHDKNYKKILTINKLPQELNSITRRIVLPKVSPFKSNSIYSGCNSDCVYAFISLCNSCELMSPDEIPNLFTYLTEKGFNINFEITKMMQDSKIKLDNNLLCFISKN